MSSLEEAKAWLRARVEEGAQCPCCNQLAKIYKRKINSTMARALITLYRVNATDEYIHTADLPGDTHEMSQLVWWGLIEEERVRREDGGRAGHWRITTKGGMFVHGDLLVLKYARVYDGRCLGLVGEPVDIKQCLGSKFDYGELMGW